MMYEGKNRTFIEAFEARQEAVVLAALTRAGGPLNAPAIAAGAGWSPAQAWKVLERLEARGRIRPVNEHRVTWELVPESTEGACGMTTPASCSPPGSSSSGPGSDGGADTGDGFSKDWLEELGPPAEYFQFDIPAPPITKPERIKWRGPNPPLMVIDEAAKFFRELAERAGPDPYGGRGLRVGDHWEPPPGEVPSDAILGLRAAEDFAEDQP